MILKRSENDHGTITVDEVVQILESNNWNITKACGIIGISTRTYYKWADEFPDKLIQKHEWNERMIDMAEESILKQIKEGTPASTIFFLKTKGRNRGYGEVVETIQGDARAGITFFNGDEDDLDAMDDDENNDGEE